jgi:hypothetical protein
MRTNRPLNSASEFVRLFVRKFVVARRPRTREESRLRFFFKAPCVQVEAFFECNRETGVNRTLADTPLVGRAWIDASRRRGRGGFRAHFLRSGGDYLVLCWFVQQQTMVCGFLCLLLPAGLTRGLELGFSTLSRC